MDIQQVRRRHEDALLGRPDVTGVGTGKDEHGRDVIVVFVTRTPPHPGPGHREVLPRELDGYPVTVVESGVISGQ